MGFKGLGSGVSGLGFGLRVESFLSKTGLHLHGSSSPLTWRSQIGLEFKVSGLGLRLGFRVFGL